ncbi:hypothetical protein B7P43_G05717 [Cryptotermes secundus]|uniref:RING-type domain-containing protein n=1 Tax=Cryptotermes secundus TaxID=105785 RepID=A0A2J7PNE1_9NEOP|nr:hypothetical protein B7P43_G05717 [Cryptotermes secundus]
MDTSMVPGDVARKFQCTVCCDYMQPPVLQCCNGHFICSICCLMLNLCPVCRIPLQNIRNMGIEIFANIIRLPCNYSKFGCAVPLLHTERREHEETCEYRLWGLLNDRVYANKPRTLQDLKDNISAEIRNITEETLQRVTANMQMRVEACLLENGGHFQHLL